MLVLYKFHSAEKSLAPDISHQLHIAQGLQTFQQVGADHPAVFHQLFCFDDPGAFQGCGHGAGTSAISADIPEIIHPFGWLAGIAQKFIENVLAKYGSGQGHIRAGQSFGHGDNVRVHIVLIMAPEFSGSAEPAYNFIHNQIDTIFTADGLQDRIVLLDRNHNATAGRDGFDNTSADRIRPFLKDHIFQAAGAVDVATRIGFSKGTAVTEHVGELRESFGKWPEILFSLQLSRCAQCADGGAMIITISKQYLVLSFSIRIDMGELADNFKGFLIGLGSAV